MQLRLPWVSPSTSAERLPREVAAAGRVFPVTIARHRWARRYVLRVTDGGDLRLTVPRGASIAEGLRFATGQADWIATEWTRLRERRTWAHGSLIWYRGHQERLQVGASGMRLGDLCVPSAQGDLREAIQHHLRALACDELPPRCRMLGIAQGLHPARVTVRDQRSRWGACSGRGSITLNWRLVQMPPDVCEYVMLHELAHLRQPNHSRQFWREVASLCHTWRASERWLREHGRELL